MRYLVRYSHTGTAVGAHDYLATPDFDLLIGTAPGGRSFVHGGFWHAHECKMGERLSLNLEYWGQKRSLQQGR